jgi:tRNA-specific 2-thiouridylase
MAKNIVYLANGYTPDEVMKDEFRAGDLHWISGRAPVKKNLQVKIRHGVTIHDCVFSVKKGVAHVSLNGRVHGVAPGQFAVFYDGDVCLGNGVIK